MKLRGPEVRDERRAALRTAAAQWVKDERLLPGEQKSIDARTVAEWRSNRSLAAVVFFVLTAFALSASAGLLDLMQFPKPGFIVGIGAIVLAEVLIARRQFGTGIESALWLGGLVGMITALPSSGKPEALLVFAAAFGIAGFRMRNPLFGAVAAALVIVYSGVKGEPSIAAPVMTSFAVTIAAAIAVRREWERPSTDRLWSTLLVFAPLTGYGTAWVTGHGYNTPIRALWLSFALLGAAELIAGLHERRRMLWIGASASLVLVACDVWRTWSASLDWKLVAAGALLLSAAAAISRLLRGRTRGLVVSRESESRSMQAVQLAGSMLAVQAHGEAPADPAGPASGGGSFGGAGASGGY